jgi:uncharacterized membrane protein YphA (DoxX/SURF4 family)
MSQTNTVTVSRSYIILLRICIGIIYFWFGALKFFHGYSPAEDLAIQTINKLTFNLVPQPVNIVLLAIWEVAIGILLISGKWVKVALIALLVHMACTFTPLYFFPAVSFQYASYSFTLVSQYIMKNIIIVSAALVLWPAKINGQKHQAGSSTRSYISS